MTLTGDFASGQANWTLCRPLRVIQRVGAGSGGWVNGQRLLAGG